MKKRRSQKGKWAWGYTPDDELIRLPKTWIVLPKDVQDILVAAYILLKKLEAS